MGVKIYYSIFKFMMEIKRKRNVLILISEIFQLNFVQIGNWIQSYCINFETNRNL